MGANEWVFRVENNTAKIVKVLILKSEEYILFWFLVQYIPKLKSFLNIVGPNKGISKGWINYYLIAWYCILVYIFFNYGSEYKYIFSNILCNNLKSYYSYSVYISY